MNIKKQELGLTSAAKRNLLSLKGVETLQDLVDMYSEQELFEDYRFQKHSVTYASILECLNTYGIKLSPTFYERKKRLGELPSVENPERILLTELELPKALIEKMGYWKKLKTIGDLAQKLREYGLKHEHPENFGLKEFCGSVRVRVDTSKELVEILHNKHAGSEVDFQGYPHYRLRESTRMHQVWRYIGGCPMGGGSKSLVWEPTDYVNNYYKDVRLEWDEKKTLVRTLSLYGLYPKHARVRPTLL